MQHAQAKQLAAKEPFQWGKLFSTFQVYVVGLAHFSISWVVYLIALNLPLIFNEVFQEGILKVSNVCSVASHFLLLFKQCSIMEK